MSSLKSLMQAKKSAVRLSHPLAKYDHAGRLSCSLCGLALKHENLWSSHLVSKAHRVNVQKEQAAQEAKAGDKRKRNDAQDDTPTKRTKETNNNSSAVSESEKSALPDDFFTDPSAAPLAQQQAEENEDDEDGTTELTTAQQEANDILPESTVDYAKAPDGTADEDPEWAAFEAALAEGGSAAPRPSASTSAQPPAVSSTIFAKPVMYEFGAPKVAEEGEEAEAAEEEMEEIEETAEEKREREELEEREEIMSRIEQEEREQIEADEKVAVLKRRMEEIKAARRKKKA